MSVGDDFLDYLRDLLAPLGPLGVKRMFGGAGLSCGEAFFAIVVDDTLYLKTDAESRPLFEAAGARPFTYQKKGGAGVSTSYWSLPEAALDDADEAMTWARRGLDAALRKPARRARKV